MPDSGAPISCIAPPNRRDPRSIATSPVLLINSITHCLASDSSPDVKRTVRGLLGEKSCIHDIGMLLIDFTSREPMAISATISLDVRPFNAARDRATPARLRSGSESICALVASTSIRPCQSMPASASGTFTQRVARITISHSADCCLVPAQAPEPRPATNSPSVSGPLELDTTTVFPAFIKWRPIVRVTLPAPINPTSIADLLSFYYQCWQHPPSRASWLMRVRYRSDADLTSLFQSC